MRPPAASCHLGVSWLVGALVSWKRPREAAPCLGRFLTNPRSNSPTHHRGRSAAKLGLQWESSLLSPDVRLVLGGRLVQLEAAIHRQLRAAGSQALHLDGPHRTEAARDAEVLPEHA